MNKAAKRQKTQKVYIGFRCPIDDKERLEKEAAANGRSLGAELRFRLALLKSQVNVCA